MDGRGHSPLGMSVLERRYCCPASMRLEAGRPGQETEYSRRGTELHSVAAEALQTGVDAAELLPDDDDGVDILAPWLATVRQVHADLGGELLVEHQFTLEALHRLYWGTADAVIIAPPHLWVGDLKTGGGHPVSIRRPDGRPNFQLAGYALGVLQSLPSGTPIDTITLCVSQPRRNSLQTTDLTVGGDMLDLAADLIDIAERALDPAAQPIPGEHCIFCRAASTCPALRERSLAAAALEFDVEAEDLVDRLPKPVTLTPQQVGDVLTQAALVKIWIAAVEAHARGLAEHGTPVPGWKLVAKRSTRKWVNEADASDALAFLLEDARFTHELLSPAQAEKALKRGKLKKPDSWDDLVAWTDPGSTLVPIDDPRPAINPTTVAALEFEHEKHEEQ